MKQEEKMIYNFFNARLNQINICGLCPNSMQKKKYQKEPKEAVA